MTATIWATINSCTSAPRASRWAGCPTSRRICTALERRSCSPTRRRPTCGSTTRFRADADQRDIGVLFRTSHPTVGYDRQLGYFAGVIPADRRLLIGRTDGQQWHELVSTELPLPADGDYLLEIVASGPDLRARVGDATVEAHDESFQTGLVGLRVVDSEATFVSLAYDESV